MRGTILNKVYTKKERESQKLRLFGGAWTINLQEIEGKEIEKIVYITNKESYSISYADAVDKGFVRVLGGESKLVVPIKYWSIDGK
jgi:hypothetical protein